jgi:hypothetical protein
VGCEALAWGRTGTEATANGHEKENERKTWMPSSNESLVPPDTRLPGPRRPRGAPRPDLEASKRWFVELDFASIANGQLASSAAPGSPRQRFASRRDRGRQLLEPNRIRHLDETLEYGGYHHVSIDVANHDRALDELRRRGVAIVRNR